MKVYDNIVDSTGGTVEIFMSSVFVMMDFWSITDYVEQFKVALNIFLYLNKYEVNKEQGIIDQFFTTMVCKMLANNQVNLAGQVFEENEKFNMADRYKALYYAVLYFRDGPESTGFLKAGPEMQESIKQIVEKVKALK